MQADDGIRGGYVTGVQTCALPIATRPRDLGRPRGAGRRARRPAPRGRPRSRGRVASRRRACPWAHRRDRKGVEEGESGELREGRTKKMQREAVSVDKEMY